MADRNVNKAPCSRRSDPYGPVHVCGRSPEKISRSWLARTPRRGGGWLLGLPRPFCVQVCLSRSPGCSARGGIWGSKRPTGWGFAIVNLVWWIASGHAGTSSPDLLLSKQKWAPRSSLRRKPWTLFAVSCPGFVRLLQWQAVVLLWIASIPQHNCNCGRISKARDLGRFRTYNLRGRCRCSFGSWA